MERIDARVSVNGTAATGARASACITVTDFDDNPTICQPLPLAGQWVRHELNFIVPSWMPATVAAAFTITGAPITLYLDDVELLQSASSSICNGVVTTAGRTIVFWVPGSNVTLAVRPSASCGRIVAIHGCERDRESPTCESEQARAEYCLKRVVTGQNYTLSIPLNASGGTLLIVSARRPMASSLAAGHRLLIAGQPSKYASRVEQPTSKS